MARTTRGHGWLVIAAVGVGGAAPAAWAGIDTFNYGNMAWDSVKVTNSTSSLNRVLSGASWANAGNPNGAIYAGAPVASDASTARDYALSSDVWSPLYLGGTVSADVRTIGNVRTLSGSTATARARWFIASGSTVFLSKAALNPNDASGWTSFSATLSASEFDRFSSGLSFTDTLLNANAYGVMLLDAGVETASFNHGSWSVATNFGLVSAGGEAARVYFDNIASIPDTGAAVATASLGVLMLVRRRR